MLCKREKYITLGSVEIAYLDMTDEIRNQSLYCDCGHLMGLVFGLFRAKVNSVELEIADLPLLRCSACNKDYLPERSKQFVQFVAEEAIKGGRMFDAIRRRKINKKFNFCQVEFEYDPDDYYYIPGLSRPWDDGFLTPVFFNLAVLLKYDQRPDYRVKFASATYGTIIGENFDISFGINQFQKVIMWLGDIDKLPKAEQYYLASENVSSDHSIGSEFYEGQIEVRFTDPPATDLLFAARSDFLTEFSNKFGRKIAHLDAEVLKIASEINAPVLDTTREQKRLYDALNQVYIEAISNSELESLLILNAIKAKGNGTLKRLQAFMEAQFPSADIHSIMGPLSVLYDLRVAALHIGSDASKVTKMKAVTDRLDLPDSASFPNIFDRLVDRLLSCFESLRSLMS